MASLTAQLRELFLPEQWNIGLIQQPLHEVALHGISKPVRWLTRPKGYEFYADPFGDAENDAVYCECFSYRSNKGVIARVYRDGVATVAVDARDPRLLPSILRHEGRVYIVPEIAQAGRVVMIDVTTGEERTLLADVPLSTRRWCCTRGAGGCSADAPARTPASTCTTRLRWTDRSSRRQRTRCGRR